MNGKDSKEEQLTLELLEAIENNCELSQRHLAKQMGVALGLTNSYLKRCIRKGFVKISEAPANRYLYYLTPKGFAEKSRLTAKYLSYSFSFYRKAGDSCRRAYLHCHQFGWNRVLLCGLSDLAEIAALRAFEMDIDVLGVYDPHAGRARCVNKTVFRTLEGVNDAAAYLVTDLTEPKQTYEALATRFERKRIFVPDILGFRRPGD